MLTREHAEMRLRESGLRLTPQRRAVIEALVDNRTHPSTEDVAASVLSRMPGVSLSTVYKTLHELSDLGLLLRLETPKSMRFDPETADHAHLVCSRCGGVTDITPEASAFDAVRDAALAAGAIVSGIETTIHGLCAGCSKDRMFVA